MSKRKSETREEYRARKRAEAHKRYWADPEAAREAARQRRKADPERSKRYDLAHHLRSSYGLTIEQFEMMVDQQDGRCFLCHGERTGPGDRLHVDHDHENGKTRALLCSKCNTALGLLGDDPNLIAMAAKYVTMGRWETPLVLTKERLQQAMRTVQVS